MENDELNTQTPAANSTQAPQVPTQNTPPAPAQPAVPQTPIVPTTGGDESKKPILWLVIGIMLILALVGGIYLYLSRQQAKSSTQTMVQTPQPSPQDNLENDLNSINVESSPSSDFAPVDSDLQQL